MSLLQSRMSFNGHVQNRGATPRSWTALFNTRTLTCRSTFYAASTSLATFSAAVSCDPSFPKSPTLNFSICTRTPCNPMTHGLSPWPSRSHLRLDLPLAPNWTSSIQCGNLQKPSKRQALAPSLPVSTATVDNLKWLLFLTPFTFSLPTLVVEHTFYTSPVRQTVQTSRV